MTERVAAIVPARDEAPRIAATLQALRSVETIDEIVVVDDASTDGTGAIARELGVRVESLRTRSGKGAALTAGVRATDAEILCFIDADLEESARIATQLLAPVLTGDADMTIAAPQPSAPSGFGLVESIARAGIRVLTHRTMSRPLSGQRALRRAVIERVGLAPRFGIEVALTIDAIRAGFRVVELPLELSHRRTGRDAAGFAHRARQGVDLLGVLGARALRRS